MRNLWPVPQPTLHEPPADGPPPHPVPLPLGGGEGARRAGEGVPRSNTRRIAWENSLPERLGAGPTLMRQLGGTSTATVLLAGATILLLAYCLISVLNARATYDPEQLRLEYHQCLLWLPHSYEST